MLQAFSDRIRNSRWLGYLIVALITVPFALWGIQSYFTPGGPQAIAEVEGISISARELDRRVGDRRQQLRERLGDDFSDQIDATALRQRVLDELINQQLLSQAARDLGIQSSEARVAGLIRDQEAFHQGGRFDPDLYRRLLARSGLRPADYEADMARQDRVNQLRGAMADSAFVLPGEARRIATLEAQEREVSLLRIPKNAARERVQIDDSAVREFYDSHPQRFRTPEQVKLSYIEVDREELARGIDVNEAEIREEFERRVTQERSAAAREAAHILLEVPDDASADEEQAVRERLLALREEIEAGADFGEIAREHSDDIGSAEAGGDLGRIERGEMVQPFEEALFGLEEPGSVSEPVRTRFGYHLIRLESVESAEGPSLDELRDEIRNDLQRRIARDRFHDRVDDLVNAAYENPASLEPAARVTGAEIRRSGWISPKGGEGIGQHEAVRAAAFADPVLDEGRNSEAIELSDDRVVVLRIADHRGPEPVPFAEVSDQVRAELEDERASELRRQWRARLKAAIENGTSIETLVDRADPPVEREGPFTLRLGSENSELGRALRQEAFDLPPPKGDGRPSVAEVESGEGEPAILALHGVAYPEPDPRQVERFETILDRLLVGAEFAGWVATLRDSADVRIHEQRLDPATRPAP